MKWLSHLRTVQHHRFLVLRHCWRVGLYWQGLTHDLSKFSPVEFSAGAKYYQGNRSPNEIERREKGYSAAWLHHKGRNKHHLEYWIDYAADGSGMCGMKMPIQYVIEMFCDRVAASKTYRGAAYRDSDPYDYYAHSVDHYIIHPDTAAALDDVTIERATLQPKDQPVEGSGMLDMTGAPGKPVSGLPAFCRVVGTAKPEAGSDIRFEVWLPQDGWTGRFTGGSNGGFAGYLAYGDLAAAVAAGHAGASTDTGHVDPTSMDAAWGKGRPERVRERAPERGARDQHVRHAVIEANVEDGDGGRQEGRHMVERA